MAALLPHSKKFPTFKFIIWLLPFTVELLCLSCVSVCLLGISPGSLVSSYSLILAVSGPGIIGNSKLATGVNSLLALTEMQAVQDLAPVVAEYRMIKVR